MQFRLTWHDTRHDNKYEADTEYRYEYLGGREAIWRLWYELDRLGNKHLAVYSLDGTKQRPERGLGGLTGYNI
jgi:hypothetical protein